LKTRAFTLIELLVTIAISAIIIALAVPVLFSSLTKADRVKAAGQMRAVGTAIFAHAADRNGKLVGPLWPGQVAQYDRNRNGRLVVELAPYLEIVDKPEPYLVNSFLTGSLRRAAKSTPLSELRIYVMNMNVDTPEGVVNPWGSAADPAPGEPFTLAGLNAIPRSSTPMLTEAWQGHPAVSSAPWKASTPILPAHGKEAFVLYFDGRVAPEI
jgi:prepilin-type N-terminal cleavage/methylation domain-containing protein